MILTLIKNGQKTLKFVNLGVMNKLSAYKKLKFKSVFQTESKLENKADSRNCFFMLLFLSVFFLSGCTTTYAPVEHRNSTSYKVKKKYTGKTPAYHQVKKGETLYSIAWKYGLDYKSIAYRNKIKSPYRIFAGDKLRLTAKNTKVSYNKGRYSKKDSKSKGSTKKNYNKKSSSKTRTVSKSSKKVISTTTSNKTKSSSKSKRAVKNNKKTATFTGSKRLSWNWPVKGKIIQRYSPGSGKKGIDISAAKGTLIKSAEAGKVVYSGQGLVGYGKLIIIKHNDTFLSAYAHNHSLLINEGQLVKKGQNIARLGRSGTDRYKLHFEIRKNGKPVNPLSYLPR